MNIITLEDPYGVIVELGGQTAINLADKLAKFNVPMLGSDNKAIANAEDRELFNEL